MTIPKGFPKGMLGRDVWQFTRASLDGCQDGIFCLFKGHCKGVLAGDVCNLHPIYMTSHR